MTIKAPKFNSQDASSYAEARRRWLARWSEYRDAVIMAECASIASSGKPRNVVNFYRAFYGVEGVWIER